MAQKIKKLSKKFIALICMFTLVFSYSVVITETDAAAVAGSGISDALSDSRPGEYANHTIQFEYNNEGDLANLDTQTFTFTGFTQGSADTVLTDFTMTVGTDGVTYGTAMIQTTDYTFANVTAGADPVYTFTWTTTGVGKLGSNPFVKIVFTNATNKLPNPTAAVYTITLGGTNNYATGTTKVVILDGIAVSATVDEYLTFSSTDADDVVIFGSWTGGSTVERWASDTGSTSEVVATQLLVSSNAGNGVSITVKSINSNSTAGLYSVTAAAEISADASSDINGDGSIAGFAVYANAASGLTIDEGFDDDDTTDLAVTTGNLLFADAAAGVDSGTVDVSMNASILATTGAGSYATTVVFVATPSY